MLHYLMTLEFDTLGFRCKFARESKIEKNAF